MRVANARMAAALVIPVLVLAACGESQPTTAVPARTEVIAAAAELAPNQPVGSTTITSHDFATCAGDGWSNCGRVTVDPDFAIVQDFSARASSPAVTRYAFPAGFVGGDAPVAIIERALPAGTKRIYGSLWFKLSGNWQGHTSGVNKLGFAWIHGQPVVHFSAQGTGSGPLQMQIRTQGMGVGPAVRNLVPNRAGSGAVSRGEWHRLEYVLAANTPGIADGVVRYWLDGEEVGSYTDVGFSAAWQHNDWEIVSVYPVWGGSGDRVRETMSLSFDHYLVSSATNSPPPTQPAPVDRITLVPASFTLTVGNQQQLTALLADAAGNTLTGRAIAWQSANGAVATVSSTGLVVAVAPGTTTLTATSEGRSATATVTVAAPLPAPVSRVTVSPSSAILLVGATQQLAATAWDAEGRALEGRIVSWSSAAPSVAAVSAGLVTAIAAGTATITATVEGISASASISVQAPPPPPPPSGGNVPAGYTVVAQQDFSSCTADGWGNCSRVTADPDFAIVQDPTAPRSGGSVARYTFPAGFAGGDPPVPPMERAIPANQKRLYGSIWFKLSENFEGHASGVNKLGYLWMQHGAIVYFSAQGAGSGPLEMQIRLQGVGAGPVTENLRPNLGPNGQVTRGEWHRFEYVVVANTPGQLNGTAQFWLDGVEIGRYSTIGYAGATQSNDWIMASVYPYWGGVWGSVRESMWLMFDHYTVASAP